MGMGWFMMTKAEAEAEALKRWRSRPLTSRRTIDDALAFAKTLNAELQFETLGRKERIVEAWLLRDLHASAVDRPAPAAKGLRAPFDTSSTKR